MQPQMYLECKDQKVFVVNPSIRAATPGGVQPSVNTLARSVGPGGISLDGYAGYRATWPIKNGAIGAGDFTLGVVVELTNVDTNSYSYAIGSDVTYFALSTRHSAIGNNCGLILGSSAVWINTGISCSSKGMYRIIFSRVDGTVYWNINGERGSVANSTIIPTVSTLALSGYDTTGNVGGGSAAWPNKYYQLLFDRRGWSQMEMAAWVNNPWQIFAP